MSSYWDDYKNVRKLRFANRSVQIILFLSLFLGLNYLAAIRYLRKDITSTREQSLAPETMAYLAKMENPVKIYITIGPESEDDAEKKVIADLKNLLRKFEFAGRIGDKNWIEFEFVDVYRERLKTQELVSRYGLKKEKVILVTSGDRRREILGQDLYKIEEGVEKAFRGEEVFLSAILDVAGSQRQKIYFLTGHGEMLLEDVDSVYGMSELRQYLLNHNLSLDYMDLSGNGKVPEDADLIVVASPQGPIPRYENEKLRRYLSERNGRLMVFLDPSRRHGMDELFYDWGILTQDMLIVDPSSQARSSGGNTVIRHFGKHDLTEYLTNFNLTVLSGPSRPVREDPGAPIDDRRILTELLATGKESWAERHYRTNSTPRFHERYDLQGPVSIAVLSEMKGGADLGIKIDGGKLAVFGCSDFITNSKFLIHGNHLLIGNLFNWMLNRNRFLNIPPREIREYQIAVSNEDFWKAATYLGILPGGVCIFGLFVYWIRKK
jgi:hypothetical protein